MDLPDIKVEGYEFLFTEHLHALDLDIAGQNVDGAGILGDAKEVGKDKDDLDQTSKEGQAVAAAFRVLLSLLRYGTETTKKAVLDQIRGHGHAAIAHLPRGRRDEWPLVPGQRGPQLAAHHAGPLPIAVDDAGGAADDGHPVRYDHDHAQIGLSMLEPKLDLVIQQGKSAVGHRLRPMGDRRSCSCGTSS